MHVSFERLFHPRGIAIVGASADLTRIGGHPIKALTAAGYAGAILPVNPKYPELHGLMGLFGSTEKLVHRFARKGDWVFAYDDKGEEIVRVPMKEPIHVRVPFDVKRGVAPTNCP